MNVLGTLGVALLFSTATWANGIILAEVHSTGRPAASLDFTAQDFDRGVIAVDRTSHVELAEFFSNLDFSDHTGDVTHATLPQIHVAPIISQVWGVAEAAALQRDTWDVDETSLRVAPTQAPPSTHNDGDGPASGIVFHNLTLSGGNPADTLPGR